MNFDDRMGSCRDKGRMRGRVGAWCLSWWQRAPVGTAWSNQVAPQRGQAQGPLIHSTPPLVPTGPWAASTSMAMIIRFGRQNSVELDLSVDEELSGSFEPCLRTFSRRFLMLTQQTPIGSGFGASTTASEVIRGRDLSGKIAIVTGGYSGIGLETTRVLRSAGARVIVPARDHDKAATALEGMDGVEIEAMDLLNPASIDAFAERFVASSQPLHILVNSAGIMACPLV